MRRILFSVALTVLVFATTSAFAADAFNWTGVYAGLQGSYASGASDWNNINNTGNGISMDIDGGMGGLFLGFNYQTRAKVVVGFDTEFSAGKIKGSTSCPNNAFNCNTEIEWQGATRVRVGYGFSRVFPYFAIGAAYTNAYLYADNGALVHEAKNSRFGLTPSVGVDFVITKNLIGRVQLAYYDFGSKDVTFSDGETTENDLGYSELKLGLGWKF